MALVRFDPMRELALMQDRMNRLFADAWGRQGAGPDDDIMNRGDWTPAVDIFQRGEHDIVMQVELPGVARGDINLKIENNTLTISGRRAQDPNVQPGQYHRVERQYGAFARTFSLPSTINSEKVKAEYRDGILVVTLPVREEARPRQITVDVQG